MKLLDNPSVANQVLELLKQEYEQEKPLPHLTELVYCLRRSYYDRVSPVPPTDREVLLFALGWGLERLLLQGQRRIESGEVSSIHFSPDFLAFTDLPGELKTTRSSSAKFGTGAGQFFPVTWQRQILGYMKCLGVTEYELVVLFMMGKWKPPFPEICSYRIRADEAEIEENWEWLQTRKTIYLNSIEHQIVPPARIFCEDWECSSCRYALRCQAEEIDERQRGKEVKT